MALWVLVRIRFLPGGEAKRAYVEPFTDFVTRYGKAAFAILCLIGLYRIADVVMGAVANVFYLEMGFEIEHGDAMGARTRRHHESRLPGLKRLEGILVAPGDADDRQDGDGTNRYEHGFEEPHEDVPERNALVLPLDERVQGNGRPDHGDDEEQFEERAKEDAHVGPGSEGVGRITGDRSSEQHPCDSGYFRHQEEDADDNGSASQRPFR